MGFKTPTLYQIVVAREYLQCDGVLRRGLNQLWVYAGEFVCALWKQKLKIFKIKLIHDYVLLRAAITAVRPARSRVV